MVCSSDTASQTMVREVKPGEYFVFKFQLLDSPDLKESCSVSRLHVILWKN